MDVQNVYLLIMDTDKDIKVQYLREYYGEDINAIRVKSINGAGIYRIVRGDVIHVPDIDMLKATDNPEVNYVIFDN